MVTVVDAVNFLNDYDEAKYLQDTGESLGEEDDRSVADLWWIKWSSLMFSS